MKAMMLAKLVIWAWMVVVCVSTLASTAAPIPQANDIILVVSKDTTKSEYENFLNSVRNAVKSTKNPTSCHTLPMASGEGANPLFLKVKLQSKKSGNIISLGFKRSDLYLDGYADIYQRNCRYRYFKDANTNVNTFLCTSGGTPTDLNKIMYDKSYKDIQTNAGYKREDYGLGMVKLETRIDDIYGKTKSDANYNKNEAQFLLMAIQMVGEACRFKYIEDKIKANLKDKEYKPDPRAISLENNWSSTSKVIAKETNPNAKLKMPAGMVDEKGGKWETDTIYNLKTNYISLLTYVPDCTVALNSPLNYLFNYYVQDYMFKES